MEDLIERLSAFRFLFSYCARAFDAPPDENFREVALGSVPGAAIDVLGEGVLSMRDIQQNIVDAVCEDDLVGLSSEFTKFFVGPEALPSPPWESVYLAKEDLLFQQSTLEVRRWFQRFGYQAKGYPHEPDDSLAAELEFVSILYQCEIDAIGVRDYDKAKETLRGATCFLKEHLQPFIDSFSLRIHERVSSSFYLPFAKMSELLVRCALENMEPLNAQLDSLC